MGMSRDVMRVGIVGAGSISRLHLQGLARHTDSMRAVALCDPDADGLAGRAAEFRVAETYCSLAEMMTKAHLDVAIVCTPTHVRRPVVLPLLEAGIPVLCEKPFAETYAEARQMREDSRRLGVPLAVNQNFRRHFTFAMAKQVLASGRLGRPLHLAQAFLLTRHDTGWRLDRRRYIMSIMSIHWFDGYRFMLGTEPVTVYCRGVNSPATEGGDDTGISVILEFPGGVVACLSESFASFGQTMFCTLDCQEGSLSLGFDRIQEFRGSGPPTEHVNPLDKAEATFLVLDDLVRAHRERRQPETSADDNLKSMRILEAAYQSLQESRVVRLEEIQ